MNTKSKTLYNNVFNKLKELLILSNYSFNFKYLQTDFEKSIIEEFRNVFSLNINILGCFFHYNKAI